MKKIVFVIVLFLALISIINSLHSVYTLLHKRDLLIAAEKSLTAKEKENTALKSQLSTVSGTDYVEEEARNKLFFVKPGEHPVFIAKDLISAKTNEDKKTAEKSNWEQWMDLFFN